MYSENLFEKVLTSRTIVRIIALSNKRSFDLGEHILLGSI